MHRALAAAPLVVVAALLPLVAGCRDSSSSGTGGGGSSSSSSSAGGVASTAEVRGRDGGGVDLVAGDRSLTLPPGDAERMEKPTVREDGSGKRFAFPVSAGELRVVYAVGKHLYLGQRVKAPLDFGAVPDHEHAVGTLFELAGPTRGALVADVQAEGGDALVVRMLAQGAYVDAPEWDVAHAKLPADRQAEVRTALAKLLEKGQPTAGLRRTVLVVPLREAARKETLASRLRELADGLHEPRASAVMLRALTALDPKQGATVACEILGKKPLDKKKAEGTAQEIDRPGREALAEAAALALATAGSDCPELPAILADDACQPWFRCGPQGPLDGHETSKQDEPLCTAEQVAPLVARDLERTPADIVGLLGAPRASLFAYDALARVGKVPATFLTTHARRRYALTQVASPSCEFGAAIGTPCHCEEAAIRDEVCRRPEASSISVSTCKFDVDDKAKKITNVVVTAPP